MLEPDEEYMLAKRWKEAETRSGTSLVTSHLRLAPDRDGLPRLWPAVSELISEAMSDEQAVKRFDPDRGFRLATYAMWWIRAAIQEYPAFLVACEDGDHRGAEKSCSSTCAIEGPAPGDEEGDLSPENLKKIATQLDVPEAMSSA